MINDDNKYYTPEYLIKDILNENKRSELLYFFNNFYNKYKEEILKLSPSGKDTIVNKHYIQTKLNNDFYIL